MDPRSIASVTHVAATLSAHDSSFLNPKAIFRNKSSASGDAQSARKSVSTGARNASAPQGDDANRNLSRDCFLALLKNRLNTMHVSQAVESRLIANHVSEAIVEL